MELGFNGKVAIVTGGARGIGESIVEGFVREGASVVIGDIIFDAARELAEKLSKSSVKVIAVKTDVTKKSDADKILASYNLKRMGPVKNHYFKPFKVDTWGKFYKKYKPQIDEILGADNLFGFTVGTFGPINLKNRIFLIDKDGAYYFIKLVGDKLVAVNYGGIVLI